MKLLSSLLFVLLLLAGCKDKPKAETAAQVPESIVNDSITETYIDSTSIGIKGLYKLKLKRIQGKDSVYATILFSEKINNHWKVKQNFICEKDGVINCDPKFSDFNNDGYNDFTYKSAIAARGANEIRTLFIFNPDKGELTRIKNSADYPNIEYNKELDCLNAMAYYGGYTNYFLKIDQDSLIPIARIDHFDELREVYRYNEKGEDRLIKRDSFDIGKNGFIQYKNFDPLTEY